MSGDNATLEVVSSISLAGLVSLPAAHAITWQGSEQQVTAADSRRAGCGAGSAVLATALQMCPLGIGVVLVLLFCLVALLKDVRMIYLLANMVPSLLGGVLLSVLVLCKPPTCESGSTTVTHN
jgi:hypothetical protein